MADSAYARTVVTSTPNEVKCAQCRCVPQRTRRDDGVVDADANWQAPAQAGEASHRFLGAGKRHGGAAVAVVNLRETIHRHEEAQRPGAPERGGELLDRFGKRPIGRDMQDQRP